jgi:hypothetical protein
MKTFKKTYIGKGKQNPNFDIVKMTLKVDDFQNLIFEKDGVKYLTFEVAKMREADQFGRTHTAYVVVPENIEPKFEPQEKKWSTDEIFTEAVKKNIITNSGSWYSFKDRKIGHGSALVRKNIESNKELRHDLIHAITNTPQPVLPF